MVSAISSLPKIYTPVKLHHKNRRITYYGNLISTFCTVWDYLKCIQLINMLNVFMHLRDYCYTRKGTV